MAASKPVRVGVYLKVEGSDVFNHVSDVEMDLVDTGQRNEEGAMITSVGEVSIPSVLREVAERFS